MTGDDFEMIFRLLAALAAGALIGYEWGHGTGMGAATEACILDKTTQRSSELKRRYIDQR